MTSTATDPAKPAQSIVSRNEKANYIRPALKLASGDIFMIIYKDKCDNWTCWFSATKTFFELKNVTTQKEAIAEAVVAITQRLAQISADLQSIPLTIQP
jgi:hypothetical protein